MKVRTHRPAYTADLNGRSWEIVIPVSGRLAPLVYFANFPSRELANQWLNSGAGQQFVCAAQEARRLPEPSYADESLLEMA
jgi:hypothetical protein